MRQSPAFLLMGYQPQTAVDKEALQEVLKTPAAGSAPMAIRRVQRKSVV